MVVGNMIGSGIFLLPASLAGYGAVGIVGWICAAAGAIGISVLFGQLSRFAPDATGGPYIYTRMSFGDFAGFWVAWGYWIAIWATNAAIAVALVGYLAVFFPVLENNSGVAVLTGLSAIWLFTGINSKPIKDVARVQLITTVLKVIPLFALGCIGLFFINWDHFTPFNLSEESTFSAITSTATLTLFAFLGMESAGIISAETEEAAKTVKTSTILGTLITVAVYISSSIVIMGIIPAAELANSSAPFADAAGALVGSGGNYVMAGCAIISTVGALNGWILMQGRIPMAAAADGLFPKIFGKRNVNGSPMRGIVLSSILASGLMMLNFSKGFVGAFTFMIMLSTLSCLIPYLFSAGGLVILLFREGKGPGHPLVFLSLFCFLFCLWIVVGCGYETVFYGFLLLLAGIPFYVMINYE